VREPRSRKGEGGRESPSKTVTHPLGFLQYSFPNEVARRASPDVMQGLKAYGGGRGVVEGGSGEKGEVIKRFARKG